MIGDFHIANMCRKGDYFEDGIKVFFFGIQLPNK